MTVPLNLLASSPKNDSKNFQTSIFVYCFFKGCASIIFLIFSSGTFLIKSVSIGVKNNILGQTINLDINLIEGEVLSKEEIIKYILDKFPPIYRPTGINLVEGKQYNHRYKKFRRHE